MTGCNRKLRHLASLLAVVSAALAACETAPKLQPAPIAEEAPVQPQLARERPRWPAAVTSVGDNGLNYLLIQGNPFELARVTLWVRAGIGRDRDSKPGLAELSARSLLVAARGLEPGSTLAEELHRLGARIDLRFEGEWVCFEASCQPQDTEKLARLLFGLVNQDAPSQDEIDLARAQVLSRYTTNFAELRRERAIERLLGEPGPNVALEQEAIKSYGSTEVRLFVGIHYRPNESYVVLQTPAALPGPEVLAKIPTIFAPWLKGQKLGDLALPEEVRPLGFVERDGKTTEVTAVLLSPTPAPLGSIAAQFVWQLFDRDGVAGLLRKRLDERGFREVMPITEDLDTGRHRIRTVRLEVDSERTTQLLDTLRAAFADLGVSDHGIAEFNRAKQRAWFLWDEVVVDSEERARAFARAKIYANVTDVDKRIQDELESMRDRTISRIATERFVPVFLVRGPLSARPRDAADLPVPKVTIATVLEESRIRPILGERAELQAIAKAGLERAAAVLGGRRSLQELSTMQWNATCEYQASIPIEEQWTIALPAGPRTRTRKILGSTVVTERKPGETVETFNRNRRVLSNAERAYFELESLTNPGALFALWAQKAHTLELEGRLEESGRSLLVYVLQLPTTKELRIGVDEENGLPRRMDTWAWRPNSVPQRVTWILGDYRGVGGLRLPHYAEKYVEGQIRGHQTITYPHADGVERSK
ncbi:MAG: insulinase family protein [Planctomycetes bacterium]|nr:insulinase family protein [Planctomycetota bacterium]MCB9890395.1 insulinase family protein [Planctomycetota bacterium]MCB9917636.1 insulinase family protein [Planctomycetota bacterium]